MPDRDKDLQALQEMTHEQWQYVNWFEEGGGEVLKVYDVYVLFEVPQYGGQPRYVGTYLEDELNKLVDMAYSWT
jgi:hypothetical protein